MKEYIITFEDDDWFLEYANERYPHFFGCPIKEIVRCRDCVHYKPYRTDKYGMMNRCHDEHGHTHKRDESDFCSRGEKRSE